MDLRGKLWLKLIVFSASVHFGTYNAEQLIDISTSSSVGNKQNYGIGVSAKVSLFDIFGKSTEDEIYEIRLQKSILRKNSIKKSIKNRVVASYVKLKECYKILPLKYQNFIDSKIRFKSIENRFTEGEVNIEDYSLAAQAKISAEVDYVRTKLFLETCYYDLIRTINLDKGVYNDFGRIY